MVEQRPAAGGHVAAGAKRARTACRFAQLAADAILAGNAKGLVANAGLVLPANLGERLGLPELLRQHVHLGKVAGGANPADHRQHVVVENVIRDSKYGLGLNHMPSGKFGANAAWLALNVIAHNPCRWMGRLGGFAIACLKAWQLRFFSLPARLVAHGRQRRLRLPRTGPWRAEFMALMAKLQAVAAPVTT